MHAELLNNDEHHQMSTRIDFCIYFVYLTIQRSSMAVVSLGTFVSTYQFRYMLFRNVINITKEKDGSFFIFISAPLENMRCITSDNRLPVWHHMILLTPD